MASVTCHGLATQRPPNIKAIELHHPGMQSPEFKKSSETVLCGIVTPNELTGLPGKLKGCVYRRDGTKVRLSERLGGVMGDYVVSDNPDVIATQGCVETLEGRGLYLGHYMGDHYGHFITETLSTFWIFEGHPSETFDYFLFHPFVFGEAIPSYVQFCLDHFGISAEKIIFVGSRALSFVELLVPERLFRLNHSADPQSRWTYQQIAQAARPPAIPSPQLYLSRRRFSRTNFERVVANEVEMEREFESRGFRVLYPETMSFEDQIALYSRADQVAGISGSGLHNSLFMQPEATVIELGDPRYLGEPAPSQALCNRVSGVRTAFVPFVGRRFGPRKTMLFDIRFLRRSLDAVGHVAIRTARARDGTRSLWRRFIDALEVAYLTVRPSAGSMARSVLKKIRAIG